MGESSRLKNNCPSDGLFGGGHTTSLDTWASTLHEMTIVMNCKDM